MMKIGFALNKSEGGPSGFLNKLGATFEKFGLAYTSYCFSPLVSYNIFANKAYHFWLKPYVFRVDGVIFDSMLPEAERLKRNKDNIKGIKKAKGVIFQTEFSRKMVQSILNLEPQPYEVILNGTNLDHFTKEGPDMREALNIPEDAIVFITSAKWRIHKRLKDIIEVYKRFSKNSSKGTYLIIIGNTEKTEISKNIIYLDQLPNAELPKYLRTADCYLFLSWLDVCPNSVIEAIACGVPVICSNQGGTKGIIEATNGGIVVAADKEFTYGPIELYNPPSVDYKPVVDSIHQLFDNYEFYKSRIDTEPIDIKIVALKYINFIKSLS